MNGKKGNLIYILFLNNRGFFFWVVFIREINPLCPESLYMRSLLINYAYYRNWAYMYRFINYFEFVKKIYIKLNVF